MSITSLNPYLFFNGDAAKAIQHYERALGAVVVGEVMRYGEQGPAQNKDLVMHAMLRVGGGLIMLSDATADDPTVAGSNVQVCLQFDDPADTAAKFDALAAGGKVGMALHDTFWGAKFGTLTDAFGIHWMFNCELKKS